MPTLEISPVVPGGNSAAGACFTLSRKRNKFRLQIAERYGHMNDLKGAPPNVVTAKMTVSRQGRYCGLPKRIFDVASALAGMILAALPMLLSAIAIMLEGDGPVIFRQLRVGIDRKPFVCYKFRTMTTDAPRECATAALEAPERYITRVGKFLRRTSLDELPQLVNVLRGDMSLIGPRPVICSEDELIDLRGSLGVYGIRPGMTGLAQVRGRDCLSNRRKAALDAQYLERMSFGYDIRLLARTMVNVICCRGVREGGAGKKLTASERNG